MTIFISKPLLKAKCNSLYFCMILILCTSFFACKSNAESTNPTNNSISMNDDKVKLKSIIDQLTVDYSSIMSMYEMDMEVFVTKNESYLNKYKSILDKMDYVNNDFKASLIKKITGIEIAASETNVRPYLDPLFKAEYVADKIQIQGYDIEDNMASVGVMLYDSYDKISSCYSELFFGKNENGEWKLTGHDVSDALRKNHKNTITPVKIVGLYELQNKEGVHYSVVTKGDTFVLENCNPECIDVGVIEYVELIDIGVYQIKIKDLEGEMIPSFRIENAQMQAFEYNAMDDKWENNTYKFVPGAG